MAGKGGVGKTTVAAIIIKLIKEKKTGSILAVDADPNSNLGEAIGIKPGETIGEILDNLVKRPQEIPAGMPKDRFIEYNIQTAIAEGEGFDLLTMGRPEGAGCYCYANNALRGIVGKLINSYDYIVVDNEAGLEHLSRRTTMRVDALLIVSNPAPAGLKAARRINMLVDELEIKVKKRFLIVNCRGQNQLLEKEAVEKTGIERIVFLPKDRQIEKLSYSESSLMGLSEDSMVLSAMRKTEEEIWG